MGQDREELKNSLDMPETVRDKDPTTSIRFALWETFQGFTMGRIIGFFPHLSR